MKFQVDSQLSTRYQQFKPLGQTYENVFFYVRPGDIPFKIWCRIRTDPKPLNSGWLGRHGIVQSA